MNRALPPLAAAPTALSSSLAFWAVTDWKVIPIERAPSSASLRLRAWPGFFGFERPATCDVFGRASLISFRRAPKKSEDILPTTVTFHAGDIKLLISPASTRSPAPRSEEHTSELQSLRHLVCR